MGPAGEGAFRRGWKDTKNAHGGWGFWLAELLGGGLVGYWLGPLVGIGTAIVLFLALLTARIVTAPVRQRDELREYQQTHTDSNLNIVCVKADRVGSFVMLRKDGLVEAFTGEPAPTICEVCQVVFSNMPTSVLNRNTAKNVAAHLQFLDLKRNVIEAIEPTIGCWVDTDEEVTSVNLEPNGIGKTVSLVSHIGGEDCTYPGDAKTRRQQWKDITRKITERDFYVNVTLKSESFDDIDYLFRIELVEVNDETFPFPNYLKITKAE
jgi:hypothetical protein